MTIITINDLIAVTCENQLSLVWVTSSRDYFDGVLGCVLVLDYMLVCQGCMFEFGALPYLQTVEVLRLCVTFTTVTFKTHVFNNMTPAIAKEDPKKSYHMESPNQTKMLMYPIKRILTNTFL